MAKTLFLRKSAEELAGVSTERLDLSLMEKEGESVLTEGLKAVKEIIMFSDSQENVIAAVNSATNVMKYIETRKTNETAIKKKIDWDDDSMLIKGGFIEPKPPQLEESNE